jgi:hypothetical protein
MAEKSDNNFEENGRKEMTTTLKKMAEKSDSFHS